MFKVGIFQIICMINKKISAVYSGRKEAWSARQDNRHYYGKFNGYLDSPARSRQPTMVVEDVEGQQQWEYDDRRR